MLVATTITLHNMIVFHNNQQRHHYHHHYHTHSGVSEAFLFCSFATAPTRKHMQCEAIALVMRVSAFGCARQQAPSPIAELFTSKSGHRDVFIATRATCSLRDKRCSRVSICRDMCFPVARHVCMKVCIAPLLLFVPCSDSTIWIRSFRKRRRLQGSTMQNE